MKFPYFIGKGAGVPFSFDTVDERRRFVPRNGRELERNFVEVIVLCFDLYNIRFSWPKVSNRSPSISYVLVEPLLSHAYFS